MLIFKVTVTIEDSKQSKLKEFMRREGVAEIKKQFEAYTKLLKEEFSQGLILPSAKDSTSKPSTNSNTSQTQQQPKSSQQTSVNATSATTQAKQATNGLKIETKKLKLVEEFKCRSNELYNCFTDINVRFYYFSIILVF